MDYPPSLRPPFRSQLGTPAGSIFSHLLRVDSFRSTIGRRLFGSTVNSPDEGNLGWVHEVERRPAAGERVAQRYTDRTTIDWAYEERKERARLEHLNLRTGMHGVISRLVETGVPWIIVILIGIAVGLVAGCLDVLVDWLSDLRTGRCGYAFYLNKNSCCSGLEREF